MFYYLVDVLIIDGIVNLFGRLAILFSRLFRLVQNGSIGFYVFAMVISLVVIPAINYLN